MCHFAFQIQVTVIKIKAMVIGGNDLIVKNADTPSSAYISACIGVVIHSGFCGYDGGFAENGFTLPVQLEQTATLAERRCPEYSSEVNIDAHTLIQST